MLEENISFWLALIHVVLIHQVFNPKADELTFKFGGRYVTFGCQEFFIVTGLRHTDREDIISGSNKLMNKYGKKGKLKRQELLEAFRQCHIPGDQVKLQVVYLVESLIFVKDIKTLVNERVLVVVDDVDAFNKIC